MKDRNIDARIQSSITHPSNLFTKYGLPNFWFEDIVLRGAEDRCTAATDSGCTIVSLSFEPIYELVTNEYESLGYQ